MLQRSKTLLATLLVLVLCFSFAAPAMPAFAAPNPDADPAVATTKAAITKILEVPYGTTVPNINFVFTVKAIEIDGAAATTSNMPIVGSTTSGTTGTFTVEFGKSTPDEKLLSSVDASVSNPDSNGNSLWYIETPDFFKDVNWENYSTGVYEYEITETSSNWTQHNSIVPDWVDHLNMSKAKYHMWVYVSQGAPTQESDGMGGFVTIPGKHVIKHIGVVQITTDAGDPGDEEAKIDPTPGGDHTNYFTSQMIFTNEYWKEIITHPALGGAMNVSKTVAGSMKDTSLYFSFQMTINAPVLDDGTVPTTVRALIYERPTDTSPWVSVAAADLSAAAKNNVSGATVTATADPNFYYSPYITITYGQAVTFKLKHNQMLVFPEIIVGSTYTITETGTPSYAPQVTVTSNGVAATSPKLAKGASLAIPSTSTIAGTNGKLFFGEKTNSAAFLNDKGDITETGLDLNDLPFVGLILLAAGGIVAFALISRRRKNSYDENEN